MRLHKETEKYRFKVEVDSDLGSAVSQLTLRMRANRSTEVAVALLDACGQPIDSLTSSGDTWSFDLGHRNLGSPLEFLVEFEGGIPIPIELISTSPDGFKVFDVDFNSYRSSNEFGLGSPVAVFEGHRRSNLAGLEDAAPPDEQKPIPDGAPPDLITRRDAIQSFNAASRFFMELDSLTRTGKTTIGSQKSVKRSLRDRLNDRILFSRLKFHSPSFDDPIGLTEVLNLFESLALSEYGDDPDGSLFTWGFECFASGRLYLEHLDLPDPTRSYKQYKDYSGLPDGKNFFLFAELGFAGAAREEGRKDGFWTRRVPGLVRSAQIFAENILGRGFHPCLSNDNEAYYLIRTDSRFDANRIRVMRKWYSTHVGLDLNRANVVFSEIVRQSALGTGEYCCRDADVRGAKPYGSDEVQVHWTDQTTLGACPTQS